ncbi:MAG TPA: lipase family protein [Candidatus Sulfotelmatobacter sp.]|jgi:triacylglycerol lipase
MGQPLDPQKALFYGQFVQAAYTMFGNQNPDPLLPEPAGIPEGWELGAWIHMCDFVLTFDKPTFYGIIAHNIANPDQRVIAIRGTANAVEWVDDAAAIPTPFRQVPSAGRVAGGFDRIYTSLKIVKRPLPRLRAAATVPQKFEGSFGEQLEQEVLAREAERAGVAAPAPGVKHERRPRPTIVTGHSLGAALATLFVMENAAKKKFDITTCCTFASPRVGNTEFARSFDQLAIDSWRIVNTLDLVPRLPPHIPVILDYDHVGTECAFSSAGFANNNPVCWHVLETYLHFLDPTFKVRQGC